jgi:hypothetical protein
VIFFAAFISRFTIFSRDLNWVLADRTRLVKDSSTELAELGLGDILNDLLAYRDGVEDYSRENQRDGDCCLGGGEERGDLLLDFLVFFAASTTGGGGTSTELDWETLR